MQMRRWLWVVIAVIVVGVGVGLFMLRPVSGPARDLTLVGDVARGQYLIRVGDCITCHTDKRNGVPELAGGIGLVTPFGTFYPPNITSSKTAGIGNWTIEQFSRAMSDGEGPQGHLYPAFPYQHYTLMTDQDVADLFAALREVPAVDTPARPHDVGFPFNIRLLLAGWNNLFFTPRRYQADAAHSEIWNRGRYLVYGPGHCVMCHSPRNLLGAIESGKELAGNPAGGTGGKAPALSAKRLTERGYDVDTIASALSDGFTPDFNVLGSAMGEVITDATSYWTDEDRRAVATYLLGLE
jgi:mono/diheme cytochrome c family protein